MLPPQHDIAELLCFLIGPSWTDDDITQWFDFARKRLEHHAKTSFSPDEWHKGCVLAAADFRIYRFSMYMMSYEAKQHRYIKTLLRNTRRIVELEPGLVGLGNSSSSSLSLPEM